MNKRRVVLTDSAMAELEAIWDHVAADASPDVAAKLVEEILTAVDSLAFMPGMGHERDDVDDPQYRFWTVKSHVIAYRWDVHNLYVAHVIHGSRDFRQIFRRGI